MAVQNTPGVDLNAAPLQTGRSTSTATGQRAEHLKNIQALLTVAVQRGGFDLSWQLVGIGSGREKLTCCWLVNLAMSSGICVSRRTFRHGSLRQRNGQQLGLNNVYVLPHEDDPM